jgi:hypothetical protein
MLSLKGNPGVESSKYKAKTKAKSLLPSIQEEKKDIDSMDMESLQRIVKKLSNELIDLKKHNREGSSNTKKVFKFPSKKDKSTPPVNKTTPSASEGINMEDIVQSLQHWATENITESKEGEEYEKEQSEQTQELDELLEKQVNSFWEIAYGVEEES